jgi:tyrosine-protein kinase Etk/Wzc
MKIKEEPFLLAQPEPQNGRLEEEVHIRDYIEVLQRRRKTFLAAFLAVLLGVAGYTFAMKPVYEAGATLHVRSEKPRSDLMNIMAFDTASSVEAELEILKSRTNAEEVVRRLHLDWEVTKASPGLAFRIAEFSSTAGEPAYRVQLTDNEKYVVKDAKGKVVANGKSGERVEGDGIVLHLEGLWGKHSDGFHLALLPFNAAVSRIRGAMEAKETRKMTSVIRLSYRDTDPERARDVVNALVQVYLDRSVASKSQEADKTLAFLDEQLTSVRSDLDESEQNLESFKSASTVVQLDAEAENLIRKVSGVEAARAGVALKRKQVEFALDSLKKDLARKRTYSPSVMREDPLIAGMAAKLAELEMRRKALLSEFTEAHPEARSVRGQIDELHRKVRATYETTLGDLGKQEAELAQEIERYEAQLKNLPETERNLARLTRHSRVNADIYTFLLQKHEESRIARASTVSNVDIIDPAIASDKPVKPNKRKNLALGLVVGLMLGLGLAFFRDSMDDTIKDPDAAKRELGWPLLAAIPFIPTKDEGNGGMRATLVAHHDPKSPVAEAFRSLRTGIHFSAINRRRQVVLVTSTFPGEGKTTIVSNLAIILSQTGERVLLIDCDLRKPSVHGIFGHSRAPGLTELLAGDRQIEDVLHNTGIEGFDVVSAGTTPPNPAELLGSDPMRKLLETLRTRYEHILIDAPPALVVTDAPMLTSMVDLALVVVEAGRVPVKAAQRVRETLETVGARVAGIVMNDKDEASYRRYGMYGYGYYKSGYYRYGYRDGEEGSGKPAGKSRWRRWLGA